MPNADESPLLQAFGGLRVNGAFGSENIAAGAARVKRAGEACRIACPAGEEHAMKRVNHLDNARVHPMSHRGS